jgi:predicted small lipoprotein YifL
MSERSKRCPRARPAAIALLAALLAAAAGCGQSGPLTLPGKRAKSAAAPAQPQTQEGDKKKDKSDAAEDGR